ncbi:tuf [Acrasis kona]|uniref:Tuf n=1 Tax=Acrasis kona TaxID=1008807 RepID=A0AAW2ZSB3_9EUKA
MNIISDGYETDLDTFTDEATIVIDEPILQPAPKLLVTKKKYVTLGVTSLSFTTFFTLIISSILMLLLSYAFYFNEQASCIRRFGLDDDIKHHTFGESTNIGPTAIIACLSVLCFALFIIMTITKSYREQQILKQGDFSPSKNVFVQPTRVHHWLTSLMQLDPFDSRYDLFAQSIFSALYVLINTPIMMHNTRKYTQDTGGIFGALILNNFIYLSFNVMVQFTPIIVRRIKKHFFTEMIPIGDYTLLDGHPHHHDESTPHFAGCDSFTMYRVVRPYDRSLQIPYLLMLFEEYAVSQASTLYYIVQLWKQIHELERNVHFKMTSMRDREALYQHVRKRAIKIVEFMNKCKILKCDKMVEHVHDELDLMLCLDLENEKSPNIKMCSLYFKEKIQKIMVKLRCMSRHNLYHTVHYFNTFRNRLRPNSRRFVCTVDTK